MNAQEFIKLFESKKYENPQANELTARLAGHTVPSFLVSDQNDARNRLLHLAKMLLAESKQQRFADIALPPYPSVDVVEKASQILSAVKGGTDQKLTVTSANPDFTISLEKKLYEIKDLVIEKTFKKYIESPSGFLFVDAEKPNEPYLEFKNPQSLLYKKSENGIFEYAVFEDKENGEMLYKCYSIDTICVLKDANGRKTVVSEVPNKMGICPVAYISNVKAGKVRMNEICNQLSELDRYNFYFYSDFVADVSNKYQKTFTYPSNCGYLGIFNGEHVGCRNGKLVYEASGLATNQVCPQCANELNGAGSVMYLPTPTQGAPEITTPLHIIGADVENLRYSNESLREKEQRIILNATGKATNNSKEAFNADQIFANTFDYLTILRDLSRNLSQTVQFALNAYAKYWFPTATFSVNFTFGQEFITRTEAELVALIKSAKDANAPRTYIETLEHELLQVRFKNNPSLPIRTQLIEALAPYYNLTFAEALQISPEAAKEKADFESWLASYEIENGKISANDFEIKKVYVTLKNNLETFLTERNGNKEANPTIGA